MVHRNGECIEWTHTHTHTSTERVRIISVQRNEDEKQKENCGIEHTEQHSRIWTFENTLAMKKYVRKSFQIKSKSVANNADMGLLLLHKWMVYCYVGYLSFTYFVWCDFFFNNIHCFPKDSCSIFSRFFCIFFSLIFIFSIHFHCLFYLSFPPLASWLSFSTPASDQQIEITLPMIGRWMRMREKWKLESISRLEKKKRAAIEICISFQFTRFAA